MTFTARVSDIRTIRQDDPNFILDDGMILCPRAGFEIGTGCPRSYRDIIAECINNGWLKPVAHIRDSELSWDLLQQ